MKALRYILCLLVASSLQTPWAEGQIYDSALAVKMKGRRTFYERMQAVYNHYAADATLKQNNTGPKPAVTLPNDVMRKLKKWARYEWENLPLVNEKGVIPDYPAMLMKSMDTYVQATSAISLLSSGGQWNLVGPQTLSYGHGRSIGTGRIDRIAFHPTQPGTFYVGAPSGGLWRTTNSGSTYTCLTNHLPNLSVSGIVVDWSNTQTLYILTGDGDTFSGSLVDDGGYRRNGFGVMKSTDGGISWQSTGAFPVANARGYKLAQSPTNANILLAATTQGLFRSGNGGATWGLVEAGSCTDVAFQPGNGNRAYAALFSGGVARFEVSTDGGASFSQLSSFDVSIANSNRISIGVTPANSSRVYLLCGPGNPGANTFYGFYRSTNAGASFTRTATSPNVFGNEDGGGFDQSIYDNCIAVAPNNADRIWVGGLVVYTSANGGNSFTNQTLYFDGIAIERDDHIHPDVHSLGVNPLNNLLYATTDGGVYVSNDNGVNWGKRYNNLPTTQIYHMDVYDASPHHILIGSQDNGIHKRFGNTSAFEQTQEGDGYAVQYKSDETDDFYAVINTKVYRLMSDGLTQIEKWDWGATGFFPTLVIHPTDNDRFFSARQYFLAYDLSGIDSWFTRAIPASWALCVAPSNANRIYGAGSGSFTPGSGTGAMWRSSDGGSTWDTVSNNPGFPARATYPKIMNIAVNPTNANQVWVCFGGTNAGTKIVYSSNGGNSWTNVTGSLPNNLPVNCIAVDENNNAYCGNDFGVFYRAAGWTDWKPFYNGLPRVPVTDLHISTTLNRIRAATFGRGVWESDLYSGCETNVTLGGSQEGQLLIDASGVVTTSAKTIGGEGSSIQYRAGNYVQGITGFEVANGSQMRAWTGPCGQGVSMLWQNVGSNSYAGFATAILPQQNGQKFPYAFIKNWQWGANGNFSLQLKQVQADSLRLILVNDSGQNLATIYEGAGWPAGTVQPLQFNAAAFLHHKLRVLLFHHNRLVHWQELN